MSPGIGDDDEEYLKRFVTEFLPELPDHVVWSIVNMLPPEYIFDFLLYLPDSAIRDVLKDQLYNKQLHLLLLPRTSSYRKELVTVSPYVKLMGYFEITQFLRDNEDLNPAKLVLDGCGDVPSLKSIMETNRERLTTKVGDLVVLADNDVTTADVNFFLSFPNLKRLQIHQLQTKERNLVRINENLKKHKNLDTIIFLGHNYRDWTGVEFPRSLSHLDLSWYDFTKPETIQLPPGLKELYLNKAGVNLLNISKISFPENLHTLMLTYNDIESVDLSDFPRNLNTLDLSYNRILDVYDRKGTGWPSQLKSLLLTQCGIDDAIFQQMASLKWPQDLKNMVLTNNPITSFSNLDFPPNLELLDLSLTRLGSLYDTRNSPHKGPYFIFPESLKILRMFELSLRVNEEYRGLRMKLPSSLEQLDLTECFLSHLEIFEFPRSLQVLRMSGNKISDLKSYNNEDVNWSQLVNLKRLEMDFNRIGDLSDWYPPPNLEVLNLTQNPLRMIHSKFPLFSTPPVLLKELNLSFCSIEDIDEKITLPPFLKIFDLHDNFLQDTFTIPSAICEHKHLKRLDLSRNGITKLSYGSKGSSKLKTLDLSENMIRSSRTELEDFYSAMATGLGVVVRNKRFKINSIHNF